MSTPLVDNACCCNPTVVAEISTTTVPTNPKVIPLKTAAVCAAKKSSCCDVPSQKSKLIRIIEIVCRIALAVFAAYLAPFPFFISFAIGTAAGIGYGVYLKLKNRINDVGENKPVCASGYMEFLANQKFPMLVSALGTGLFIAAHARHDPFFYSPFIGIFTGFGIGRNLVQWTSRAFAQHTPANKAIPASN